MRSNLLCIAAAVLSLAVQTAMTAPAVRVIQLPKDGEVPDAEVAPDGSIHVAYVVGEDVFYIASTNRGKTFGAPLRVNSDPGTAHPANMYRGPDVAIGKNGRVHVIWYVNAYQRKLPQDQWGVFYAHHDPGQTSFSKGVNLNHTPSDNYSLAADERGDVSVIWMANGIFVNTSKDNGETFAPAEKIAIADPCECCASRATYSAKGALMIDYRDKAKNIRDMYLLMRAPGAATFTKEKMSGTPWEVTGCPMTGTFLGYGAGEELIAWETKGAVYYARIDPLTGKRKTSEIKVAERGRWPIALAGANGSALISWKNDSEVKWQFFDKTDRPTAAPETKASRNTNRHAAVALGNDFLLFD